MQDQLPKKLATTIDKFTLESGEVLTNATSGIFLAQSYLHYQGDKFNARFDANCNLHILNKIDSHGIARERYPGCLDDEAHLKVLSKI
ncbi:homoserine o-acetyltransferase [Fusarium beomiforme]|uniref:Homoserine o-acetyltransferase n=1 Tax=Fusarium beomiforme TaxID=44412 RepID=A0A9P5E089_9HYPO|nr:homoserine o-acetyltransferase [Fusarium beomiforme]